MKRLLLIIPTLVRGGAEKQLVLLAGGLPREEFDVHVCVLTHSGPLESELKSRGISYQVLGKRWKVDPLTYARLRKHIKRLRPEMVHTWLFAANAYGRHAAHAAGVPHIIGGERSVDPWKADHELWIDRRLARRSDRIATNSQGVVDFYAARGIAADKFTVIPNGVSLPTEHSMYSRAELLAELNLPLDVHLIGAIGRLWPQKRLKDLIWSTELLKSVRDDTHLLIVGDGPQRSRLERFTRLTGLRDRVHFLGQRADVTSLLPHLTCLWLGSGYEGQSNAVLEAMSHGVPVVATDIPGNRDLVVPGETGYLVPVGDSVQFARRTLPLLDDANLARRLGAAGRERIATCFTIEQMVAGHIAMYRSVMQS
jgi:glycosyltransferase involved in cell wall biosynthesis